MHAIPRNLYVHATLVIRQTASVQLELCKRYEAPWVRSADGQRRLHRLTDVRFSDPQIGWAIGVRQLLSTKDGGRTWRNQYPRGFERENLHIEVVHPVNSKTCWLLAPYVSHEVRCFLSEDGGQNWVEKYRFFSEKYRIIHLDMFFLDAGRGWILCGEQEDGPRTHLSVHSTVDGGSHWSVLPLGIGGRPRKITFADARRGWLIAGHPTKLPPDSGTTVYTTGDGGASWTPVAKLPGEVTNLYAVSQTEVFATGWTGRLFRSIDAGSTWQALSTRTHAILAGIHFRGPIGIAVGTLDMVLTKRSVAILATTDGGISWHRIDSPICASIFYVYLTGWDRGVMASMDALYQFRLRERRGRAAQP